MLKQYLIGSGLRFITFFVCTLMGLLLLRLPVVHAQTPVVAEQEDTKEQPMPGAGRTIKMARATWDTGWFQAEIFKQLLESLGYTVDGPRTRNNRDFYQAVAEGEIDLWINAWFPLHDTFVAPVRDQVEIVGFQVKGGALQGYMVDKKSADSLSITSLADFTRPEVVEAFDFNDNGKADLIGCNRGWACERVIEYHLDVYGLRTTVEQIKGDYSPLMADTVRQYNELNSSIFFYNWTPNWTNGVLRPAEDVVWIGVPYPSLPPEQSAFEDQTTIKGVVGCVADPCPLGFPPNDIRAVGNKAFFDANPAVRNLLESVVIPLTDISAQNALIFKGEDDNHDIRRHAQAWIENNQTFVNRWLEDAQAAYVVSGQLDQGVTPSAPAAEEIPPVEQPVLRVAIKTFEPFVIYDVKTRQYTGFSIELWEKLAAEMGVEYNLYGVNSIAKLLDEVQRAAADIATAGIGITSQREQYLNFSHPYFQSGLQIMVADKDNGLWDDSLALPFSVIFSRPMFNTLLFLFISLLISAHIIWFFEKDENPEFPQSYKKGIWESFWWSAVTVTTVGYGDKTPKGIVGRVFGLVWMFVGLFVLGYFTAGVAATFAVQEVVGHITGPDDLFGKQVATIKRSTAAEYLAQQGIRHQTFEHEEGAYNALIAGEVDAVVYDAPVLQHYALDEGLGQVKVVGLVFQAQNYGMALPVDSPYREALNLALLRLIERGEYQELYSKWFGGEEFSQ